MSCVSRDIVICASHDCRLHDENLWWCGTTSTSLLYYHDLKSDRGHYNKNK